MYKCKYCGFETQDKYHIENKLGCPECKEPHGCFELIRLNVNKKKAMYNDLADNEKILYNAIQKIFIENEGIKQTSFVKVLGMLINKYKLR